MCVNVRECVWYVVVCSYVETTVTVETVVALASVVSVVGMVSMVSMVSMVGGHASLPGLGLCKVRTDGGGSGQK